MSKSKLVKILVKAPGEEPVAREIPRDLRIMQGVVGGYVQCVSLPELPGVELYCDEDGKSKPGARPNFLIFQGADVVVGTAFFVGRRGTGMSSLTEKQEQRVREWLNS